MAAPKAKTKMTRSNWSKAKRPNTKSHDLSVSRNVTVMARYGAKSLGNYAVSYMSRDNAAVAPVDDVGVKSHDIDVLVSDEDVALNDVSRESMGIAKEHRLFDSKNDSFSKLLLAEKLEKFSKAQKSGHTPIIEVVSFSQDYLIEQQILSSDFKDQKGLVARSLDDTKLRKAIQSSMKQMAEQSGFSELEYVAAIHGNTTHPHVHIAMIETDDDADGRLAAREASDQLLDEVEDVKSLGKSPAAISYDKSHHVKNTVERGMMRQSEMDYFRQEIDNSLTNMSQLVSVRDLEYQQSYASVVNLDVTRQAYHDENFMADFAQVAAILRKPIHEDSVVTLALDRRIEKMSRQLLSGTDFGQKDYMTMQYRLGLKLAKEKALRDAILIHSTESPTFDDVEDYRTMGLDPQKYNGIVLTPSQFLDKEPDLPGQVYTNYVERYQKFINEPSLAHLDGLVLKRPEDFDVTKSVSKFMARQDQQLVDMTKASVYQMLMTVKASDPIAKDIKASLAVALKNIRPGVDVGLDKKGDKDHVKSFQKRLRTLGVQKPLLGNRVSTIVSSAETHRQVDTLPREIKSARELLVNEYNDSIHDIDAMMTITKGKKLHKEQRYQVLQESRNLREVVLGKGDLTQAGSMLHAALSAEIYDTGSLDRVHKLKLGDRESLFAAYRETTVGKLAAVKTAVQDLNQGASFSEPSSQQTLRTNLTDTLEEMADGYASKLKYVSEISDIVKLPEDDEKEALAQLMLSQALWRQGMDEGLAARDIEQNIKSQQNLSTRDKLATAMTLNLNELSANIETSTEKAEAIVEQMTFNSDNLTAKSFDPSKLLNDHIVHNQLVGYEHAYDNTDENGIDDDLDIVYDPATYECIVQNQNVIKQSTIVKSLTEKEEMSLSLVIGHFADKAYAKPKTAEDLERDRRESQGLSYQDLVVVDNDIARAYDSDREKELYDRQQILANVSDVELERNIQALESYQRNMALKNKAEKHEFDKDDDLVLTRDNDLSLAETRQQDNDKDRDEGISR